MHTTDKSIFQNRTRKKYQEKARDGTKDVWEQTLWGEYLRQEESLVLIIRVFLYFKVQYKYVRRYAFAKILVAES